MKNYFDSRFKVFILSMTQYPRNADLTKQLTKMGINYDVVSGANPKTCTDHLKRIGAQGIRRALMTPEQMACTFGHYLMYEKALESNSEFNIFLEEDCVLDSQLFNKFLNERSLLNENFIMLGACGGFARLKSYRIGEFRVMKTVADSLNGSHAYFLNRRVLKEFLRGAYEVTSLPDTFQRKSTKQMIILPYIATQMKDGITTIPLKINSQKSGRKFALQRKLLSSLKLDLLDRVRTGTFGGRVLRLNETRRIFSLFYRSLPGCTD